MRNENWPNESSDALEAVETVIHTAERRGFLEANFLPCKGDTMRERRRKVILDLCLLVIFICSLVIVWITVIDPMSARKSWEDLAALNVPAPVTEVPVTDAEGKTEKPKKPEAERVRKSAVELLAINDDYVGWIKAPGAKIDMPVVQTLNNNYYLYRNFARKPSRYGNPFMDYRVSLEPRSTNLIIYGHNMADGSIFTKLTNYQKADTVRANPILTLELPREVLLFKVIAVLVINGRPQDDNGYVFAVNTPDFPNKESFDGYVRQLEQRTYVKTGVDVQYGDTLLSLQTCVYDFKDEYLYVIGRLVRPGESPGVPAGQIKKANDPRVPQALCNKYGWANHYKDAERWEYPD
jgi:SrtB family sortase